MRVKMMPLLETFKLESDPDGVAEIVVRQAREGEVLERQDMFSKITRVYDDPVLGSIGVDGKLRLEVSQNRRRLWRKEAYLTLASITGVVDDSGNELFRSKSDVDGARISLAMDEGEFARAWGYLPREMINEIIECIYKVNPDWDPDRSGE